MQAWLNHPWLVRGTRAAAVILAAVALHLAGERQVASVSPDITLAEARLVFPTATRLGTFDRERRAWLAHAADDSPLGYVLTTSPDADELLGYSGPSNLIIGLTIDQKIAAVRLLTSRDTPAHVFQVRDAADFWKQFAGRSPGSDESIAAVSGSTLTSLAMAEGIERRLTGKVISYRFAEPLQLAEVQQIFPSATMLAAYESRPGWLRIQNQQGELLGYAVRTSPAADNVIGYSGPTECWAALDRAGRQVLAVRLRKSFDTVEYVDRVRDDEQYLNLLANRTVEDWARIDFKQAGIEGVSGATQTSYAVAEGLRRRFVADVDLARATRTSSGLRLRDLAMFCLVGGALAISFSRLKGNRTLRFVWQFVLIAGFGLWLGDLLSLALLNGWAKNGWPWQSISGLIVLAAVALLVPWATRHNVYCHHLCPHGAAQEWLGRFRGWHVRLPARLIPLLSAIPILLLSTAFAVSLVDGRADLSWLEPFDAWSLKMAAIVPFCIAVIGLISSLFVPMAYCRFGCPTGALLKLVQSHGAERFRRRDLLAISLIALGLVLSLAPAMNFTPAESESLPEDAHTSFAGSAFGTTWKVQLRTPQPAALQEEIAAELSRIENLLSHWRPESSTSQFNGSRTTLAMEMPEELLALITFGSQLSAATDGAFDLTVAPLADAWGFGPTGPRDPPSDEEIAKLLPNVGWRNLIIDEQERTLRKKKPGVKIDLGALLQGYAADRIGNLLDQRASGEYLIEVGGELKARGSWNVAIENPADKTKPLRRLTLQDAALATSGVYRHAGHILDPRAGRPVPAHWQLVAVIRPTCLEADGWATAILASSERAAEVAEQANIAALLVDQTQSQEETSAGNTLFQTP